MQIKSLSYYNTIINNSPIINFALAAPDLHRSAPGWSCAIAIRFRFGSTTVFAGAPPAAKHFYSLLGMVGLGAVAIDNGDNRSYNKFHQSLSDQS